ncbi:MAG TPA: nucleoside kinase [Nocardioides sp.]|nr:nucleoside kinase [Nocardioides sp.]
MGVHNFLVEGVSGTGKTSVCHELRRRGFHAVNGDVDLAYQGDPATGLPSDTASHEHHLWDLRRVHELIADHGEPLTFLCGGSRNFRSILPLLDGVFVLEIDRETLEHRLDARVGDEWGAHPDERALVLLLHRTGEDVPDGIAVDATAPLEHVVDEIVRRALAATLTP